MTFESRYKLAIFGVFPILFLTLFLSTAIGLSQNLTSNNAMIYLTLCLVLRFTETTVIVLSTTSLHEHPFVTFRDVLCCESISEKTEKSTKYDGERIDL